MKLNSRRLAIFLATLLGGTTVFLFSTGFAGFAMAPAPQLGPNCGVGATIAGSDAAGKVTIGTAATGTCTLTFTTTWDNEPACMVSDETNGAGLGGQSTRTTLTFGRRISPNDGDVVSYICVGY